MGGDSLTTVELKPSLYMAASTQIWMIRMLAERLLSSSNRRERALHDTAVAGGAVGIVGFLSNLQWESDTFCPQMNQGR